MPDEPDPEPEQTIVTLRLNLTANSGSRASQSSSSRADGWDYEIPTDYEQPTDDYEKIEELRVIIVRPDHNFEVEINKHVTYDVVWDTRGQEKFEVVGGEKKLIYLIANEKSLPENIRTTLSSMEETTYFNQSLVDQILTADDTPFIDNSGSSKKYVPMTEFFEYNVPKGTPGGTTEVTADFFVTRTTTKFSFAVERGETSSLSKGMQITSITFSGKIPATGLGTQEYLFPKHAIYSPEKYTASTEKHNGREIVSFAVPQTAGTFSYTFTPDNFGLNKAADSADGLTGLSATYVPLDYFLESGLKEFTISITTVTDGDIEYVWEPATLTNLPRLPRNTHVAVLFTLTDKTLQAVVKLVPYIGVSLDYIFGFDELIPWNRPKPE